MLLAKNPCVLATSPYYQFVNSESASRILRAIGFIGCLILILGFFISSGPTAVIFAEGVFIFIVYRIYWKRGRPVPSENREKVSLQSQFEKRWALKLRLVEAYHEIDRVEMRAGILNDIGARGSIWEGLIDWEDAAGDGFPKEKARWRELMTEVNRLNSSIKILDEKLSETELLKAEAFVHEFHVDSALLMRFGTAVADLIIPALVGEMGRTGALTAVRKFPVFGGDEFVTVWCGFEPGPNTIRLTLRNFELYDGISFVSFSVAGFDEFEDKLGHAASQIRQHSFELMKSRYAGSLMI